MKRATSTLIIPTIVIAETAGCGQVRGDHLTRQIRHKRVKAVTDWIECGNFIPVEITLSVALRAASLAIDYQLTGADAAILAAAELHGCAWLFTWDGPLLKVDGDLGDLQVTQPQREYPAQPEIPFE